VKSLEAVVGYRWSDYASAGNVEAYKAELVYEPVTPLRLRGSVQHAVRAPSVYELYLPQLGPDVSVDFFNPDPCSISSPERNGPDAARVEALCIAQGLPADLAATYVYNDLSVPGVYGGNPDLQVEAADTLTAGVVVNAWSEREWLRNLQLSVDWYRIEIEDAIDVVAAADFVLRCYDVAFNPTLSAANPYCTYFGRDTTTGTIRDAKEIYRNLGLFKTCSSTGAW
jgi:outer membrane receptor protein involved in Fe transport